MPQKIVIKQPAFLRRNHSENVELPKTIKSSLRNDEEIGETLDRVAEGEILFAVRRRRFFGGEQQRFCRLDKDFLYFRHSSVKCNHTTTMGGRREKKIDLRNIHVLLGAPENCISERVSTKRSNYFSIVFRGSSRLPLSFVTPNEKSAKDWVRTLNYLKMRLENLTPQLHFELTAWELYNSLNLNRRGLLSWRKAKKALIKQGFFDSKEEESAKQTFSPFHRILNFNDFFELYKIVTLHPEIKKIFHRISADKTWLTSRELFKFLQDEQREKDVTIDECEHLIDLFEFDEEAQSDKRMSELGFNLYVMSSYCELFDCRHGKVYQDMNQPLSHYYIASSHNTYLLGDQITEASSVEAYMNVLLKGCRCVEIDCWDGPDNEPIIYHGYTLTSKIKFKDALEVISRFAFTTSEYPLILSLENHCSLTQQEKMAYYLKTILGSELLTEPFCSENKTCSLPSPSSLRGKILIKAKTSSRLKSCENDAEDVNEVTDNTPILSPTVENSESVSKHSNERSKFNKSSFSSSTSSTSEPQTPNWKISPALSELVVYCKSVKFTTLDNPQESVKEMSSFSERKAARLIKTNAQNVIDYHKWKLSRSYPSGARTGSSNYDPQPLWNAGFQIVALNYQTKCVEMDINTGKFRQNGNCGYILKPLFQRLSSDANLPLNQSKQLRIYLVSGPRHSTTEYELEISLSGDREETYTATSSFSESNDNIVSQNADFFCIVYKPELVMLRFVLREAGLIQDQVGQYALPFTSIAQGYRHVSFLDSNGTKLNRMSVYVFVKISDLSNNE